MSISWFTIRANRLYDMIWYDMRIGGGTIDYSYFSLSFSFVNPWSCFFINLFSWLCHSMEGIHPFLSSLCNWQLPSAVDYFWIMEFTISLPWRLLIWLQKVRTIVTVDVAWKSWDIFSWLSLLLSRLIHSIFLVNQFFLILWDKMWYIMHFCVDISISTGPIEEACLKLWRYIFSTSRNGLKD